MGPKSLELPKLLDLALNRRVVIPSWLTVDEIAAGMEETYKTIKAIILVPYLFRTLGYTIKL